MATPFHDERLPVDVERGAKGGPRFRTTVTTLFSGHEQRNIDWQRVRGRWDIGYGIQDKAALDVVVAFFYVRQGRAVGFRFKDWQDYIIGDPVTDTEQSIGAGDGIEADFQVFKRYNTGGSNSYDRTITRLVSGTVRIFEDGVEVFANWTIDVDTGILTRSPVTPGGVDVGVILEYDVPARFDVDELDIDMEVYSAGSIPNIPVVELREGP